MRGRAAEPRSGARVEETARILRIDHLLDRSVSGLSGGDRQRVALGRAIVRRPKAFLMDEPLGALDAEFRHLMCGELRALHDRLGATTVYVTHDQLEAMAMADKIAVMNNGVVEQLGTAAGDLRPTGLDVRGRLHRLAADELPRLAGAAQARRSNRRSRWKRAVAVPEVREDAAEGELALGVRPEHVALRDASPLRGEVFGAEYLGTTQIVTVTTARGQREGPHRVGAYTVRQGEQVGLQLPSRTSCRCSMRPRAGRSARRCTTEVRMAEVAIEASPSASEPPRRCAISR